MAIAAHVVHGIERQAMTHSISCSAGASKVIAHGAADCRIGGDWRHAVADGERTVGAAVAITENTRSESARTESATAVTTSTCTVRIAEGWIAPVHGIATEHWISAAIATSVGAGVAVSRTITAAIATAIAAAIAAAIAISVAVAISITIAISIAIAHKHRKQPAAHQHRAQSTAVHAATISAITTTVAAAIATTVTTSIAASVTAVIVITKTAAKRIAHAAAHQTGCHSIAVASAKAVAKGRTKRCAGSRHQSISIDWSTGADLRCATITTRVAIVDTAP